MKYMNSKIACGVLSLLMMTGMISCKSDFLDEEAGHKVTDALLEDETGALKMAAGLYGNLRWHFGYEWAYGITLYGTDEFTNGGDLTSECWNTYDNRLNSLDLTPALGAANKNCPAVSALWDEMYYGIATANLVISKAVNVKSEEARNKALGEAYFLRGYNYYRLFSQYGGVVIELEPANGDVKKNYKRSSAEETLNQVIADFEEAYKLLPTDKWRGNGTWTKYTAAHFLAKALLYRQSERCNDWNGNYDKNADLNQVIKLSDEVIVACPLAANYSDLYNNWTGVDCPNEGNAEILMAALHNDDSSTKGRFGNRTYNYFSPQFQTFSGGYVQRGQYIGDMEFQRLRPTEYAYSIFDNVNDSRMWKSFKTVYGINNAAKTDAVIMETHGIKANEVPNMGDAGIVFILNKKDDHRFDNDKMGSFGRGDQPHNFVDPETGKWIPNVFPTFLNGKYVLNTYSSTGDASKSNVFCGLGKTADGTRTAEKGDAHRDIIMARTGETYLVKAEAQVRLGNYQEAIVTINVLRARSQWKSGENRGYYTDGSMAFKMSDGGLKDNATANSKTPKKNKDKKGTLITNSQAYDYSMTHTNSYYLSTGIDETTAASNLQIASYQQLPAEDEIILKTLGCSSDYDRMLNFIMNERTREMLGEWNRWEELSRTGLLIRRAKAFNPEAAPNITANKHELRPIPQKFLDILQNDSGENLSDAEKADYQNPGY